MLETRSSRAASKALELENLETDFVCVSLYFQALPKVPVPPLEQTMSEYLRAIQPIVPSHQYEKTERIVRKFSEQPGPRLYQYLVDKREAEDNWVSFMVE